MIFISDIQRAVAEHYSLPLEAMTGRSRKRVQVYPRQVAICLSRRLTEHSTVRIGYLFGHRDHSTIIIANRAAEKRCQRDPIVAEAMRRLTFALVQA